MSKNKINYSLINITALMLLLYIGFNNINLWIKVASKIISLLGPFIIGFVFAYALNPVVRYLESKGVRRWIALVSVILFLVLAVLGLLIITLPMLYDQVSSFAKYIIEVIENIGNRFNLNLGGFEIKIADYFNEIVKYIGSATSSGVMNIISTSLTLIGKIILGFVGFIYFLIDMDKIKEGFKNILLSISKKTYNYFKTLDVEIGNYIKGLGIFMVIQFFEYSFLFFIVGHPNWLVLGLLACVTTVIPYFGGLITNLIAIVTASLISTKLVIFTIIICLIFPQLDGYIISPKIYGKTNNVNPLITIMVVSVGGSLMGVVGIIAALPIYLLIRSTYLFFKKDIEKSVKKVKRSI
ncbi:MAG: AI-2E family transporter [Bacilli bacterium]|nr:AI-2E family transporter [Bacilli bacterium]